MPQRACLGHAFGHQGVGDAAFFQGLFEQALELAAGVAVGLGVRVFQHHTIGRAFVKRHPLLREVLDDQTQRKLAHHLKAGQPRAQVPVGQAQQVDRRLQRGHGRQRRQLRLGQRVQLHGGRRNDAQCALRADKQVPQVVAGVVLAQAGQAAPDLALGGHDFQAQTQLAGIAIAHYLGAPGIGAQIAADGATALGGQTQREQKARLLAHLLQGLQHAAGLDCDGQVGRVQGAHRVHAREAEHHLGAAGVWRGAHHHASVAALGHDAHACRGAGLHHRCHLLGRGRAHHGQGLAALALAPVQLVAGQVTLGEHIGLAHDGAQRRKEGGVAVHAGSSAGVGSSIRPARRASRSRRRMCRVQATNSTRHSSTSSKAQ